MKTRYPKVLLEALIQLNLNDMFFDYKTVSVKPSDMKKFLRINKGKCPFFVHLAFKTNAALPGDFKRVCGSYFGLQ